MNRGMRNRTYGGVRERQKQFCPLLDHNKLNLDNATNGRVPDYVAGKKTRTNATSARREGRPRAGRSLPIREELFFAAISPLGGLGRPPPASCMPGCFATPTNTAGAKNFNFLNSPRISPMECYQAGIVRYLY